MTASAEPIVADRVFHGMCQPAMAEFARVGVTVDAIVTDPPYNVGMDAGEGWDEYGDSAAFVAFHNSWAREAFKLLKPGGFLCAFSAARTYHQLAMGLETAGFDVVDQLMWIYAQGRPKGVALDRAIDEFLGETDNRPVVAQVAMKSFAVHAGQKTEARMVDVTSAATEEAERYQGFYTQLAPAHEPICLAQKPFRPGDNLAANVVGRDDRVEGYGTGGLNITATGPRAADGSVRYTANVLVDEAAGRFLDDLYGSECARVFYCPKTEGAERRSGGASNSHPTVKPVAVMDWLCKLVTRPGGLVLDPFAGSGTTLVAARLGGFHWLGIEMSEEFAATAERRARRSRMAAR